MGEQIACSCCGSTDGKHKHKCCRHFMKQDSIIQGCSITGYVFSGDADVNQCSRFALSPEILECRLKIAQEAWNALLPKQKSLLKLGLSGSTVYKVTEFMMSDDLDEAECLEWLKENIWMIEDSAALNEVTHVLRVNGYFGKTGSNAG